MQTSAQDKANPPPKGLFSSIDRRADRRPLKVLKRPSTSITTPPLLKEELIKRFLVDLS